MKKLYYLLPQIFKYWSKSNGSRGRKRADSLSSSDSFLQKFALGYSDANKSNAKVAPAVEATPTTNAAIANNNRTTPTSNNGKLLSPPPPPPNGTASKPEASKKESTNSSRIKDR